MKNLNFNKITLLAFAALVTAAGCKQKAAPEKAKPTGTAAQSVSLMLDTGKANKESFENIHLYYHDLFGRGHTPTLTGARLKLSLKAPVMLVNADEKQTFFLVYPGERVYLRYTRTDSLQLFIPGNEQRTRELDFFRQLIQKTGSLYYALTVMPYHQKVSGLDALHSSERVINQVKNKRLNF